MAFDQVFYEERLKHVPQVQVAEAVKEASADQITGHET